MDEINERIAHLRKINWEGYGISKWRYAELKAFCMQYGEKKSKINRGISKKAGTENQAIDNVALEKDCEKIETAAVIAAANLAPYILESVTRDIAYEAVEYDPKLGRIPVGRTDFYAIRRYFYHVLDKTKE